jgi:hypothetical protein
MPARRDLGRKPAGVRTPLTPQALARSGKASAMSR